MQPGKGFRWPRRRLAIASTPRQHQHFHPSCAGLIRIQIEEFQDIPHMVTLLGSPPNRAMYFWTHRMASRSKYFHQLIWIPKRENYCWRSWRPAFPMRASFTSRPGKNPNADKLTDEKMSVANKDRRFVNLPVVHANVNNWPPECNWFFDDRTAIVPNEKWAYYARTLVDAVLTRMYLLPERRHHISTGTQISWVP